ENVIPFTRLDERKIAVITSDSVRYGAFIDQLKRYGEVECFGFDHYGEDTKFFNTLIIAGDAAPWRPDHVAMALQSATNNKEVILALFGAQKDYTQIGLGPKSLGRFASLIYHPDTDPQAQQQVAMSIFGGMAITQGKMTTVQTRLQYTQGEKSGLDIPGMTALIDDIAKDAIAQKATPGMMVMAIKDGQVIFEKAYGHHTYQRQQQNQIDDIYDLASISKIVGTTPVIMHLTERG